jgi:hypothetical protein
MFAAEEVYVLYPVIHVKPVVLTSVAGTIVQSNTNA